ncbi:MAG: YfgM family protein [Steroidobacteraceae bacterium]
MVDEYLDEREQAEQLKKWFKENWLWLVAGVGLGLGGLYGWQGWNSHLDRKAEAAAVSFGELVEAVEAGDRERATTLTAALDAEYGGTAYAGQAQLMMARVEVESGEYDAAATRLQGLSGHEDAELATVARLRLARIRLQQEQPDATLEVLAKLDGSAAAVRVEELRGDARWAQGDPAAAAEAYRLAVAAAESGIEPGEVDLDLLQLKLAQAEAAGGGVTGETE